MNKLPQLASFSVTSANAMHELDGAGQRPKNEQLKDKKRSSIRTTSKTYGAGGRGRTDTSCYGPRILSPVRLPFRHTGIGGTNQIRTGDEGFADPSLTTWRWCHKTSCDYIIIYDNKKNCNTF